MDLPPQTDRLLRRLDGLEAPVVQVWGWPGSGRASLLRALLAREGEAARALPAADLEAGTVRAAVSGGARWLVAASLPTGVDPHELVTALAEALPPDRHLVFATGRRLALPDLLAGLVTPRDLALEPSEILELAERRANIRPSLEEAQELAAAADGWYRPLVLAFEAVGQEGAWKRLPGSAEEIAALPAVADFLRTAVLAELAPAEREALARPRRAAKAVLHRLRDELGFLIEAPEGLRPLYLLRAVERGSGEARGGRRAVAAEPEPGVPDLPVDLPPEIGFRVHLLGRPEVWRRLPDGTWHRLHWPLKRAFRALAFLASSPERKASREDLVDALWPDEGADVVRRNFHPTLSHLRRGLRERAPRGESRPVRLRDGVYALAPDLGWWTDVEGLAELAELGRTLAAEGRDEEAAAAWEAGWRLYRGDFLEGAFEVWAVERREEHRRTYLRLLQDLAAARERLGRLPAAMDAFRAVLVEDPLQERAHVALMRLYARLGRRDMVRRQYQRLTGLLRDELGIEPLPETTEEYHRLMTDRIA